MAGVIVPLYPGVFSAIGLLMSDVKHDYIRSRMTPIAELEPDDVEAIFAQLEAQARDDLRRDGFAEKEIRIDRALDMRYAGQGYEITHVLHGGRDARRSRLCARNSTPSTRASSATCAPEEPVEVVSYRVRGIGLVPAGLDAEVRAAGRKAFRRAARDAAGALRRQDDFLSGLSARKARRRADACAARRSSISSTAPQSSAPARSRASMNGRI